RSIANAISSSASSISSSTSALSQHVTTNSPEISCRSAAGRYYNPAQLKTGPSVGHGVSLLCWRSGGVEHPHDTPPYPFMPSPTSAHSSDGCDIEQYERVEI